MIDQTELDFIKRSAEQKTEAFLQKNPGVQVPPDEGPQSLRLVAEIERLYGLAESAVATRLVRSA
jgi:hypothetical protein